ncbi:hypothetical protein FHU41_002132 [Psychromicrobium silvestre]|uniref:Uncharacterized protein n=1 Tax=Psychromicrobium silvestre TaxID=1645614 RepID=A0A7Y9LUM1_9MICC|nr:hypothetical protein [Psychromicrobium silvestre]NYE95882.1 hypothetical protein [Psychromicrobium silvestre]
MCLEAAYYGVGIVIGTSVQLSEDPLALEVLLEPAPFLPSRYTGALWRFAEVAYDSLRNSPG